ncbi:holo-ACP synthase [Lacticaseibacillus zhaodongensis]|uniref:holo-ACP synthase n=1 Tax=Lacticaseibacillus zhaodongensis TaxID=2668065 RepID=UPI0012D32F35|nr:holo-ACP synthase [Lacticaseibacillus zhaodongensis]
MIKGIGVDVSEIDRIAAAQRKHGDFAKKVLTAGEYAQWQQYRGRRADEYLAGRFSVKESYAKAYGTGLGSVQLHDVETLSDAAGRPYIAKGPHQGPAHVSISHSKELVFTEVILEGSN